MLYRLPILDQIYPNPVMEAKASGSVKRFVKPNLNLLKPYRGIEAIAVQPRQITRI